MQIVITVAPDGQVNLQCSEDRPWTAVRALKAVADALVEQQAQKEAPAVVIAQAMPAGLLNGRARVGK